VIDADIFDKIIPPSIKQLLGGKSLKLKDFVLRVIYH
jgi:hypothetical protein